MKMLTGLSVLACATFMSSADARCYQQYRTGLGVAAAPFCRQNNDNYGPSRRPPMNRGSVYGSGGGHTACPAGTSWNADTHSCIGYFKKELPAGYDGWERSADGNGRFRVRCVANCPPGE